MLLKILGLDNFICNFYFLCLVDRHQSLHTDVLFIRFFLCPSTSIQLWSS